MAIAIDELKVNNIVLAPDGISVRRCIVKSIGDDTVAVDFLNMQTGKMENAIFSLTDLEPVIVMESTLYAMGFRKTDNKYYGLSTDTCYVFKRDGQDDVIVIKTNQWHLLYPHGNCWSIDKHELHLHTLQNYMSDGKEFADAVSHDKFVELTNPYCVLPFEPK